MGVLVDGQQSLSRRSQHDGRRHVVAAVQVGEGGEGGERGEGGEGGEGGEDIYLFLSDLECKRPAGPGNDCPCETLAGQSIRVDLIAFSTVRDHPARRREVVNTNINFTDWLGTHHGHGAIVPSI